MQASLILKGALKFVQAAAPFAMRVLLWKYGCQHSACVVHTAPVHAATAQHSTAGQRNRQGSRLWVTVMELPLVKDTDEYATRSMADK